MRKFQRVVLLAAALLPAYASATEFSYNYAQAAYISTDFAGIDGDGFALDGSLEINKNIAFIAGYETTGFDEFGIKVDIDTLTYGFAFHMPVSDNMDVVLGAGLTDTEVSFSDPFFGDFTVSDTGNFLSAGIRVQANPQTEFSLAVKRLDAFDETETGIDASMLFNFNKGNQIGISFSNALILDEVDNLYFRFRSNF